MITFRIYFASATFLILLFLSCSGPMNDKGHSMDKMDGEERNSNLAVGLFYVTKVIDEITIEVTSSEGTHIVYLLGLTTMLTSRPGT